MFVEPSKAKNKFSVLLHFSSLLPSLPLVLFLFFLFSIKVMVAESLIFHSAFLHKSSDTFLDNHLAAAAEVFKAIHPSTGLKCSRTES